MQMIYGPYDFAIYILADFCWIWVSNSRIFDPFIFSVLSYYYAGSAEILFRKITYPLLEWDYDLWVKKLPNTQDIPPCLLSLWWIIFLRWMRLWTYGQKAIQLEESIQLHLPIYTICYMYSFKTGKFIWNY